MCSHPRMQGLVHAMEENVFPDDCMRSFLLVFNNSSRRKTGIEDVDVNIFYVNINVPKFVMVTAKCVRLSCIGYWSH